MDREPLLDLHGNLPPAAGSADNDGSAISFSQFSSILKYMAFILLAPIAAFFVTKNGLSVVYGADAGESIRSNVISAAAAVIVLHVGLGVFIYKAYFDTGPAKRRIGKQE